MGDFEGHGDAADPHARAQRECVGACRVAGGPPEGGERELSVLASHPSVALAKRQQSGGGAVLVQRQGGKTEAWKVVDAVKIMSITGNLGDAEDHDYAPGDDHARARMTQAARDAAGIGDALIRVAVGRKRRTTCATTGARVGADLDIGRSGRLTISTEKVFRGIKSHVVRVSRDAEIPRGRQCASWPKWA